ncbi:dihydroorotate dehydrogenase (quinone) [archaeon]|nr:dihydroorotate dehydrogenase (quinone) [archaeon]|tara:strand:- start:2617 stop:3654 length:1038 start_codon:yes stop_codon:yes gene_type:complete
MKPTTLDLFYKLSKPLIFGLKLDAEFMHRLATKQIMKLKEGYTPPKFSRLSSKLFDHEFSYPLMLAAGFDKNGTIVDKVHTLGFNGEVVGSVTAQPSKGNKRPRLWRLIKDKATINRMGLDNDGAEAVGEKLENLEEKVSFAVSIAKTNDPKIMGDKAIDDYLTSYKLLKHLGVYTEINISCPNTEDGKTFENPEYLKLLLKGLLSTDKGKPLLIKISPFLEEELLQEIVNVSDNKVDGYVAINAIPVIHPKYGRGGKSGLPLQEEAILTIKTLRKFTDKPIIGSGGIFTGEDAYNFLNAGANLLQGFTGFIYRGPLYAIKVAGELDEVLKRKDLNIKEIKRYLH